MGEGHSPKHLKNESEVQEIVLRGAAGSRRRAVFLALLVASFVGAENVPGRDSNTLQLSWKSHVTASKHSAGEKNSDLTEWKNLKQRDHRNEPLECLELKAASSSSVIHSVQSCET